MIELSQSKAYRQKSQSLLLSGVKAVSEYSGPILYSGSLEGYSNTKVDFVLKKKDLEKITGECAPQGIVIEVPMPTDKPKVIQKMLVLWDLIDPGNVGTLIRTAHAFGWDAVFVSQVCSDPFSPKAIRSSKGAALKIPIIQGTISDLDELVKHHNLRPVIACAGKESPPTTGPVALIMGSESKGIDPVIHQLENATYSSVQMKQGDSLNVAIAGGILMNKLL